MVPTLRRSRNAFDDFFGNEFGRALSRWADEASTELVGSYPVDITEDDAHLYVEAELPGFTRDQVEVTLENGVLTINAQRKETEKKNQSAHLHERRFTRVTRAFSLPTLVNEDKVEAKLDNGVLHLTLHKREEVRPRKIEVK